MKSGPTPTWPSPSRPNSPQRPGISNPKRATDLRRELVPPKGPYRTVSKRLGIRGHGARALSDVVRAERKVFGRQSQGPLPVARRDSNRQRQGVEANLDDACSPTILP